MQVKIVFPLSDESLHCLSGLCVNTILLWSPVLYTCRQTVPCVTEANNTKQWALDRNQLLAITAEPLSGSHACPAQVRHEDTRPGRGKTLNSSEAEGSHIFGNKRRGETADLIPLRVAKAQVSVSGIQLVKCWAQTRPASLHHSKVSNSMMDEDEEAILVFDIGSGSIQYGPAGEDCPSFISPSVLGRPVCDAAASRLGVDKTKCYLGEETAEIREMLSLRRPIQRGIVTDWDDMEKVLNDRLYRCSASECQFRRANPMKNIIQSTKTSLFKARKHQTISTRSLNKLLKYVLHIKKIIRFPKVALITSITHK